MSLMKPRAIIVDIDGTIANHMGHDSERSHYDYSKVDQDLPFQDIIDLIGIYLDHHHVTDIPLIVTGREGTEECRGKTIDWLKAYAVSLGPINGGMLFMRPEGDHRPDTIIKEEIYKRDIEPFYDVKYVFEDRSRVVKMWRELGLRCLQVADGDF